MITKKKMIIEKPFQSTHGLIFETGGPFRHDPAFTHFRIGTVNGIYSAIPDAYIVLAILNNVPGNGHMDDFFEYFERSCRRDKKAFRIIEILEKRFRDHLIQKRGFTKTDVNAVEKVY